MRISTSQMSDAVMNALLDQQVKLSRTQLQVATGKRVLKPSDDPVSSATSLNIEQYKAITERYKVNADAATARLSIEELALDGVSGQIQRTRELTLQGVSETYSDEQRRYMAQEIRELLAGMLQAGNTQDNNGKYIFAGTQGDSTPFLRSAAGGFEYHGDDGQRLLQIGPTQRLADSDPGSAVFMDIRNGNGVFQIQGNAANTGDARISNNSVLDSTLYAHHSYQVAFVDNAGTMEYTVTDTTSGAVVVPATAYVSGGAIAFDGISLAFEGVPADGDSFAVSPSDRQSLFQTVQNIIDALESDTSLPGAKARVANEISQGLGELDLALDNILSTRSLTGARMNTIDAQVSAHDNVILQAEQTLSTLTDVDFAEAVARMNQQLVALEAAQKSYTKVQGLSLFNYIF